MRGNEGLVALCVLAGSLLFLGARAWDDQGRFNPARTPLPAQFETGADGGRLLRLDAGPGGHFFFEGQANGSDIRFMVDTGASVTTLTESDAARAGLSVGPRDFNRPFETANGTLMAATGRLAELRIGEAVLYDLEVAIAPDEALGGSLFGMNGLNRFDRREATRDELILRMD